jgi:hypothetical protein
MTRLEPGAGRTAGPGRTATPDLAPAVHRPVAAPDGQQRSTVKHYVRHALKRRPTASAEVIP